MLTKIMSSRLRKLSLTSHVTSSVGWLGAVAAYLVLAVVGLTSRDSEMARAGDCCGTTGSWRSSP